MMSTETTQTTNIEPEDYSKYELLPDVYDPEEDSVDEETLYQDMKAVHEDIAAWNRGESRMRVTRFINGEPVVSYETRQESEEWEARQRREQEHQADTAA